MSSKVNKSVMTFIIRALSHVREKRGKAKRIEKAKKYKKMREKDRRGNATILLPHLCFKVAP